MTTIIEQNASSFIHGFYKHPLFLLKHKYNTEDKHKHCYWHPCFCQLSTEMLNSNELISVPCYIKVKDTNPNNIRVQWLGSLTISGPIFATFLIQLFFKIEWNNHIPFNQATKISPILIMQIRFLRLCRLLIMNTYIISEENLKKRWDEIASSKTLFHNFNFHNLQ